MSDNQPQLLQTLEDLQEQYRQQSLEERLEDVAEDLRDIKLQIAIMDALFDESPTVDEDLTQEIRMARAAVQNEEYETLADMIDGLEQTADEELATVEQDLTQELVSHHQQVQAMCRLNERLEAYSQSQLKGLEILLDKWNWKSAASIEDLSSFEAQLAECREFGAEMRGIYEDAQEKLIEPLIEDGLRDVVGKILDSEQVYLGELSESKREALADSELGEYMKLSLG